VNKATQSYQLSE